MTIEELEEKMAELEKLQTETENAHAKLKAQIAELKALREELPEPPHPRWKPELWEDYFYCSYSGSVYKVLWTNGKLDNGMYNIGNVFRTEEETEFEAERLKVLAEMREWAGNWDDGVALKYDGTNKKIFTTFMSPRQYTFGEMRFATREDAEGCIKAVGEDRIKKYYFMIPEDKA